MHAVIAKSAVAGRKPRLPSLAPARHTVRPQFAGETALPPQSARLSVRPSVRPRERARSLARSQRKVEINRTPPWSLARQTTTKLKEARARAL